VQANAGSCVKDMKATLIPHPQSRPIAISAIAVDAQRSAAGRLRLRYEARARAAGLALPAEAAPERSDGLWRTTCFEAFLRPAGARFYYEFNFSPSSQWAAYRFDGYREGTQKAPLRPMLEWRAHGLTLAAEIDLAPCPDIRDAAPWLVGFCAVIEESDGRKSYWALAHPDGAPDFHHDDCFAGQLAQEPAS
jgi:hypothetical protein